jgi:MYXO-CTERM domain-containing protein
MVSGGDDNSGGINAMATTSDSSDALQILLYNYNNKLNTASGSGDSQAISVTGLPAALAGKEVFVTTYVVDENNSNPYSVWKSKASSCTSCTEDQLRLLKAAQHLSVTSTKKTVDTTFSTTVTMLKQSAMLIILSTKRPLMGRDAFTEIEAEDYDGQSSGKAQDSGEATLDQSMVVSANGYLYFEKVDYSDDGASSVDFRYKAASDATVELRQDSDTGTSLGKCTLAAASSWTTQNCKLSPAVTGVSKLYLMFGGAAEVNYLKFQGSGSTPGSGGSGAGGSAAGGTSGGSNGGASGSAAGGSTGRGGAAGNAAGGVAGNGNGGVAGSGNGGTSSNSNGNGGSPNGGAGNSGGSSGNGNGGSASGGSSGAGGSSSTGSTSSGCSCRIGDTRGPSGALVIVGFIAAALGLRRGKPRRRK